MEGELQDKSLVETEDQSLVNALVLYEQVREILDSARARVARGVNLEMVRAYWLVGQAIVEHEQQGKERADYDEQLVESLGGAVKSRRFERFPIEKSLADARVLFEVLEFARSACRIELNALPSAFESRI